MVSTHPSHRLILREGVYLCYKCGYKAQFRINKLASQCTSRRSTYGQGNLEKAEQGTLIGGPKLSSSSQDTHPLLLNNSPESITTAEVDAIGHVENQVVNIQNEMACQLAVPSIV